MEKFVINALMKHGIEVKKLDYFESDCGEGLLHEPIKRFVAYTSLGEISLVVKTENIQFPPEVLFRNLYLECGKADGDVDLEQFDECCEYLSMKNMPKREYFFYKNVTEQMKRYVPRVWDCIINENTQIIIMEDLNKCLNMNMINSPEVWSKPLLLQAMRDLATIHYELQIFRENIYHDYDLLSISKFLTQFHAITTFGCEIEVNYKVYNEGKKFIDNIVRYDNMLLEKNIVIHNDFNIRNMCIEPNNRHLKVYDWEFMDIGCPMFDVIDFLLSISPIYIKRKVINEMIQEYASYYCRASGTNISFEYFINMFYYSALKYSATRMNMYLLCYKRNKLQYIERMYHNLEVILELYESNQ